MTTTQEQLSKLENEASRAAIEWWQKNDSRIGAGRIDAYKAGYLRRCQETEQALTPITADDVTDEMLNEFHEKSEVFPAPETLAIAYNAVIKNRSEAK